MIEKVPAVAAEPVAVSICCGDEGCTERRAREQDLRAVDEIAAVDSERECAGCK